jgi:hypothetical protein
MPSRGESGTFSFVHFDGEPLSVAALLSEIVPFISSPDLTNDDGSVEHSGKIVDISGLDSPAGVFFLE